MAQVLGNNVVTLDGSDRQLSRDDQAALRRIVTDKYGYVVNDLFGHPDAERVIFDEAPEIARPDTSWYHPVMENISSATRASSSTQAPPLTAEQERALFLKFNYCRYRVAAVKAELGHSNPDPESADQILHWHHKAEHYRERIAQTNLALVLAMAKRTRMSEVDFSDLVSEGNMALLRAVDKFDAARGFKFSTYACRAILKAFSRIAVKLSKYRQFFPTDFDPKLEKSDFMERKRLDHEMNCADEIRLILDENRAELTDIEQDVIEHRFAIGTAGDAKAETAPMTLEQVGKIIGVTKERVRQIQNKALQKIRHSLEEQYLN
jgi:RNA polymerase primary sigma factor